MKKLIRYLLVITTLLGFFQITGCQKLIEVYHQHHDDQVYKDTVSCDISSMGMWTVEYNGSPAVSGGFFKYNEDGKPASFIFPSKLGFMPSHYFYYDSRGRLKEYKVIDAGDSTIIMHHWFGYVGNSTIVHTDTAERISLNWRNIVASVFTYDDKGRIIKESRNALDTVTGAPTLMEPLFYNYSNSGNLLINPTYDPADYDDKVNFLRTNAIWMMLERNYSTNNLIGSTTYTAEGLPSYYPQTGWHTFLHYGGQIAGIAYTCDPQ